MHVNPEQSSKFCHPRRSSAARSTAPRAHHISDEAHDDGNEPRADPVPPAVTSLVLASRAGCGGGAGGGAEPVRELDAESTAGGRARSQVCCVRRPMHEFGHYCLRILKTFDGDTVRALAQEESEQRFGYDRARASGTRDNISFMSIVCIGLVSCECPGTCARPTCVVRRVHDTPRGKFSRNCRQVYSTVMTRVTRSCARAARRICGSAHLRQFALCPTHSAHR